MSNGLILTSKDGKKEFHITASGPIDATVVFPNKDEFPMVPLDEVKPVIAKFLYKSKNAFLEPIPVISFTTANTNTLTTTTSITSTIFDQLGSKSKPNKNLDPLEGILWQVALDKSFSKFVKEYYLSGTDIPDRKSLIFDANKIVELELAGNVSSDKGKTPYFIRLKYFRNGKTSEWSNVLEFFIEGNLYGPITKLSAYPQSDGGLKLVHSPYTIAIGNLTKPEFVNVHIGKNGNPNDPTSTPINIKVPYNGTEETIVYPKFLGNGDETEFNLKPLDTFRVYMTYEGKDSRGNTVVSNPSPLATTSYPSPFVRVKPGSLKLLQGSGKTSSIPTLMVEDVCIDYNYHLTYSNYKRERLGYIEHHGGTTEAPLVMRVDFVICDHNNIHIKTISESIDVLDIEPDDNLSFFTTLDKGTVLPGREYVITIVIVFVRKDTNAVPSPNSYDYIGPLNGHIVKIRERINSVDNIPTDNFTRPKATHPSSSSSPKYNAYYGEILKDGDFGLMSPDVNYRGTIRSNTVYKPYDEVVIKDKLYIVVNQFYTGPINPDTYTPDLTKVTEVTEFTHKAIYKSGLPTYEWLARRIGIPYKKSVFADKEGKIVKGDAISRVLNNDSGWIKCANYAKQHVYIAKRPIVSNISYRELQRRFLTGEYSRTIRIGLNYFSVRLLELGPTNLIDPVMKTKNSLENPLNLQNELELYSQLFRVTFGSYQPDDLGLDNDVLTKTFMAKGILKTSSIVDTNNNVVTTVRGEEINEEEYDSRDHTYYYRPILELIRYDNIPLLKSKQLPGSLNCKYDKWSDTGYYGEVGTSSFISPEEIKSVFNIPYLQVTNEPVSYHKFYYHGLVVYIPNRPIGMISKEDMKLFNASGNIYGTDTKGYMFRGSKYIMTLPNLHTKLYMDKVSVNNNDNYSTTTEGLQHVHDDSIIGGLVNRISNIFTGIIPGDEHRSAYHTPFIQDITTGLDSSVNGVLLKDLILDRTLVEEDIIDKFYRFARFKDGKVLTGTEDIDIPLYEQSLNLWPVFITEAADYTKDFSYPNLVSPRPTIVYEKKKVITYEVQPKVVKRERQVKKTKVERYPVEVVIPRPIETGRHEYENVEIFRPDVGYNLAFIYAKKTDRPYFTKPLYDRSMLKIKPISGEYIVRWSNMFRSLDEYLLRSYLLSSTKLGYRYPIPINKKFEDSRDLKTYLKTLVRDDITIGSLTNQNYDRIQSFENKYPLGMFYGTISSRDIIYPIPTWYNLYEDDQKDMVRYPMILKDPNGNLSNDISYVKTDNGDKLPIPLMSNYLAYEDFSTEGKGSIIEPIVTYLTNLIYNDRITPHNVEEFKKTIRDEYVFGIFGLELSTARYLEGGINEGKVDNPRLISIDTNLDDYLKLYPTVKDILNPKKVMDEEMVTTMEWKEREVTYYELEEYEVTIYEEVRIEKEITVPVVKYT